MGVWKWAPCMSGICCRSSPFMCKLATFQKHLWHLRRWKNLTPIYMSMSLHEFILTVCACSCVWRSGFFALSLGMSTLLDGAFAPNRPRWRTMCVPLSSQFLMSMKHPPRLDATEWQSFKLVSETCIDNTNFPLRTFSWGPRATEKHARTDTRALIADESEKHSASAKRCPFAKRQR